VTDAYSFTLTSKQLKHISRDLTIFPPQRNSKNDTDEHHHRTHVEVEGTSSLAQIYNTIHKIAQQSGSNDDM